MNRMPLILLLLLPLTLAHADDVYNIQPLTENELLKTYTSLLRDACRFSDAEWHDWPADRHAGYWGNGVSSGNEGIRAISNMVFTSGVLLKYCDEVNGVEREQMMNKSIAAIRYVVSTHKTGTQKCVDGKQWGGDWQSAYWTGTTAFGAWLIWDQLDTELQQGVERVVTSEADRFLGAKPPTQFSLDTKAEENGWNLLCISAAANMFPAHPHAAAWNEKAIEYMMNTLSVPNDMNDDALVDGLPIRKWIAGANLYPEFTLENHSIFHPAYLECSTYFLTQSTMLFTYAGRKAPQAADHHLMDTWQVLQTIMLPCGESAFPQGMDWELHGLPDINLVSSLATLKKEPVATGMEKIILQRIRAWQQNQHGDLAVPGSRLGFTRHSIVAEQVAYGYLAHKLFGPASANESTIGKSASLLAGVHNYPAIDITIHRTKSKFFSFSWKNRIMGLLAPIGEGHDNNPHFTFPILNGFVGSTELRAGGDAKTSVLEHSWKEDGNGFETSGTISTNGNRLKQTFSISSVGEKVVIYQDHLTALADVSITRQLGVPVGIENDPLAGGQRVVEHEDGKIILDWRQPPRDITIPGRWANVDRRLGVVSVAGSDINYRKCNGYNAQAVCTDVIYGSFSNQRKDYKAGEEIARRIVLFAVEVDPEETSKMAASVMVEDSPHGGILHFSLPEGGMAAVQLR